MTIHVLLADDQVLLRRTFRILLESCVDIEVVGEASDGREAVELARVHRPDIVVMDIRMPCTDGLTATTEICADPELIGTKVLILTTFELDIQVECAVQTGASGFLGRDAGADELISAIRTVAAGETLLSPKTTRLLIGRFLSAYDPASPPGLAPSLDMLTSHELEATTMAAHGLSDEEIADRLLISPYTARTHIHRAMAKLNVRDRAQLVVVAFRAGLATI